MNKEKIKSMDTFNDECDDFELDLLQKRQPLQVVENWCDVYSFLMPERIFATVFLYSL